MQSRSETSVKWGAESLQLLKLLQRVWKVVMEIKEHLDMKHMRIIFHEEPLKESLGRYEQIEE